MTWWVALVRLYSARLSCAGVDCQFVNNFFTRHVPYRCIENPARHAMPRTRAEVPLANDKFFGTLELHDDSLQHRTG